MRFQPTQAQKGDDDVQTPYELALRVARHFRPSGSIWEPCCGDGNFARALLEVAAFPIYSTDIKTGDDFLDGPLFRHGLGDGRWDWIITNPPWSKIRGFLARSMEHADNVVFLITVNHAFTKARVRDVRQAGFGLKEILLVDTPKKGTGWPQMGFQLGAVHWQRGYAGTVTISGGGR